jgi:hypothetical protein
MEILAGGIENYAFDAESSSFLKSSDMPGPKFGLRRLNYWEWQRVLALDADPVEEIRLALQLGLVHIDGDIDKAKAFLASPAVRLVNPLFKAIAENSAGN